MWSQSGQCIPDGSPCFLGFGTSWSSWAVSQGRPPESSGQLSSGRDQAQDDCGRLRIGGRAPSLCEASGYHFQAIKNTNYTWLNTANSFKKKKKYSGTSPGQAVAPKWIQIILGYTIGEAQRKAPTSLMGIQSSSPSCSPPNFTNS